MKNRIIGTVVAGSLLLAASASAETIIMAGQSCQGETAADRSNMRINTKAIANESTTSNAIYTCPFSSLSNSDIEEMSLIGIRAFDRSSIADVSCTMNVTNENGTVFTGANGSTAGADQVAPKHFFINPPVEFFPGSSLEHFHATNLTLVCSVPPMEAGSRSGLASYSATITYH